MHPITMHIALLISSVYITIFSIYILYVVLNYTIGICSGHYRHTPKYVVKAVFDGFDFMAFWGESLTFQRWEL